MVVEEMNCVKQDLAKEVEKNQLLEESIEIERLKSPKSMGSVDLILKGPVQIGILPSHSEEVFGSLSSFEDQEKLSMSLHQQNEEIKQQIEYDMVYVAEEDEEAEIDQQYDELYEGQDPEEAEVIQEEEEEEEGEDNSILTTIEENEKLEDSASFYDRLDFTSKLDSGPEEESLSRCPVGFQTVSRFIS